MHIRSLNVIIFTLIGWLPLICKAYIYCEHLYIAKFYTIYENGSVNTCTTFHPFTFISKIHNVNIILLISFNTDPNSLELYKKEALFYFLYLKYNYNLCCDLKRNVNTSTIRPQRMYDKG